MSAFRKLIIGLLVTLSFTGCVPNRKIVYVQDSKEMAVQQRENMYFIDEPLDNTIRQGDELYIKVSSADETRTNFNQDNQNYARDPALISFTVDDDGKIKMPYVDRIKLSGLTLLEASDKIEEELSQYLLYPSVFIRFVNNKVTILGEVKSPGVYVFNYKNVNILQAIGYANGIGIFGNRRNVLVVREEGRFRSKNIIDLTSDALLTSPFYMVKSNDIIYVEPLKQKKWGLDVFPYELLFAVVSLTIVVLTFMVTYIN